MGQVFNAATARIILRYIVGGIIGMDAGSALAGDPDIVMMAALGVGAAVECVYAVAKKRGWTT